MTAGPMPMIRWYDGSTAIFAVFERNCDSSFQAARYSLKRSNSSLEDVTA